VRVTRELSAAHCEKIFQRFWGHQLRRVKEQAESASRAAPLERPLEENDPATYYFRTTPRFETAHPAYAFLNRLVAVASGDRRPEGPIYTIHEVL